MMRLKERYQKEIAPALKKEFGFKNSMLVPRLTKVVLNVGFGKHSKDKDVVESVGQTLEKISGQKPVFTKAKKSVSAFKIREGMVIGAMVTLRDKRMYDFVDKLVNITFPRVRDFRGISDKAVDRTGNLTVGFKENVAFPEIHLEDINSTHGLEVIIATNAKNRAEGLALFQAFGFPFKKNEK
jgi:large subunit ribosomal protein L5